MELWNSGRADIRFDLHNINSCELIAKHVQKTNFLECTGLRHAAPLNLRNAYYNPDHIALNPSFKIDCDLFDVTKEKSKDYYSPFVRKKDCFPNKMRKLKCEFHLTDEALRKAFSLPHSVAFEPYVKAFQFEVLNFILYRNSKLHKIGYIAHDVLSASMNQKQCSIFFGLLLFNFFLERFRIILLIFDKAADSS